MNAPETQGHYAKKQLSSRSKLVVWSHGARFRLACRLVEPYAGGKLLDYGCGDGTFLEFVADRFQTLVGADVEPKQCADAAARLAKHPNVRFCLTRELSEEFNGSFDAVTCMETLEHVPLDIMGGVLDDLRRVVKPSGVVIISVPIEIGPTLPLKQIARRVAGWRNIGDYRYNERYTWGELLQSVFASERTSVPRNRYTGKIDGNELPFHGHKGFNYKALRKHLRDWFQITRTLYSPLGWSRGLLSSQAWMICRAK